MRSTQTSTAVLGTRGYEVRTAADGFHALAGGAERCREHRAITLPEWMTIAPHAQPACGMVGALVSANDFFQCQCRVLTAQDTLMTGKYRFRYYNTPQLPHGWDAGVMFEETQRTMLCSDLFHQDGNVEPITERSVLDRVQETLTAYQAGPLANYVPYTPNTGRILEGLATLQPKTLAIMHGSSFSGDGAKELLGLAGVMQDVLSKPSYQFPKCADAESAAD